jgi:hypothetical protein
MGAGELLRQDLDAALLPEQEWEEREAALLVLASRQADDIEKLEAVLAMEGPTVVGSTGQSRLNPAFAELRQSRLALARILGDIRMPDEGVGSSRNIKKVRSAQRRWVA